MTNITASSKRVSSSMMSINISPYLERPILPYNIIFYKKQPDILKQTFCINNTFHYSSYTLDYSNRYRNRQNTQKHKGRYYQITFIFQITSITIYTRYIRTHTGPTQTVLILWCTFIAT